jgi:hypothetical protein
MDVPSRPARRRLLGFGQSFGSLVLRCSVAADPEFVAGLLPELGQRSATGGRGRPDPRTDVGELFAVDLQPRAEMVTELESQLLEVLGIVNVDLESSLFPILLDQ